MSQPGEISRLLASVRNGDADARARLLSVVYDQLRRMAAARMRVERPGHTLQASALVHEAYLRMLGSEQDLVTRAHFFGVAAVTMRRILVDHARAHRARKRDGGLVRVEFDDSLSVLDSSGEAPKLIALDQALDELAALNPRHAQVVEMRFFAGMTVEESAEALGVSEKTIKRDWAVARAWLRNRIEGVEA